ncbi:MAG: OmpA family protein [Gammaproteobacteria bacterium]|nr:OmpA family protein [Gammaproteobacteria bacterium]
MTQISCRLVLTLLLMTLLAACAAPKNYIVLLEGEDGKKTGAVVVTNENGSRVLDKAGHSMGLEESESTPSRAADSEQIENDFSMVLASQPPKSRGFLLYFEFGTSELTAESSVLIPEIISEINSRAAPDIGIIGHTDTAGSAETNAELALVRAQKVHSLLISAGVNFDLIEVSSHGETNLLISTEDGIDEPRNRRVEVLIR